MHKVDTSQLYATYPHLMRIDELWGKPECRIYLTELMSETRDGARTGFAPDHASTLLRLLMEHDRAYPDYDDSFKLPIWQRSLD